MYKERVGAWFCFVHLCVNWANASWGWNMMFASRVSCYEGSLVYGNHIWGAKCECVCVSSIVYNDFNASTKTIQELIIPWKWTYKIDLPLSPTMSRQMHEHN